MYAVWSLWTKPFKESRRLGWPTLKHHLLSWILSIQTAKKHFHNTSLVTDNEGAKMLIDGLGLEFEQVSLDLNRLAYYHPDWWAIGKLYAYALQTEPFVHIDNDVFLWEPLPTQLTKALVFAQNPEFSSFGCTFYHPQSLEYDINRLNGWLPPELDNYLPTGGILKAACCGILGGVHVDFLKYYAKLAIKLIEHPSNQIVWSQRGHRIDDCILFEQYLLLACVDYHKTKPSSVFNGIDIQYLFSSHEDAVKNGGKYGYTHLMVEAKRNLTLLEHLEKKVSQLYPELYERCIAYLANVEQVN